MGVTIVGGPTAQYPRTEAAVIVETKASWSADWQLDTELEPQRATRHTGAQDLDTCVLLRRYGPAVWDRHTEAWVDRDPRDLLGHYVRLKLAGDEGLQTIWQGRVADLSRDVRARNETYVAYGGLDVLGKIHVHHSYWWDGSQLLDLGRVPSVNLSGAEDLLVGNRSTDRHDDAYVYERRTDGGAQALWTHYEYLQYLLEAFVNSSGRPTWTIGGTTSLIQNLTTYIPLRGGDSIYDLLRLLVPPRCGMDYYVAPTNAGYEIRVFALTAVFPVAFAGAVLPENADTTRIDLGSTHEITECVVERSQTQMYDHIRVVGERKRTQFTLRMSTVYARKLWTDELETSYKDGTGTPSDPAAKHDNTRRDDMFRNVFQAFAAVAAYDFQDGYNLPPKLDLFGAEREGVRPDQQSVERRTLPRLLTREGHNYAFATPLNNNPTGVEADFMPPLAMIQMKLSGLLLEGDWIVLNKANEMAEDEGIAFKVTSIEALDHEWGLRVNVAPNHALAKNRWTEANPSSFDPDSDGFNYDDLAFTIAIETDEHVEVGLDVDESLAAGDGSTLVVRAPGCHYWYLAPETYLGVYSDGTPRKSWPLGLVLRDDTPRMALLAAGAIARYAYGRNRARVTQRALLDWSASLGTILSVIEEEGNIQALHIPVTSVEWNFRADERTTTMSAGHAI